jgi:hypothetical protein
VKQEKKSRRLWPGKRFPTGEKIDMGKGGVLVEVVQAWVDRKKAGGNEPTCR